ncbi:MAG: DUF4956 domain-containing protein [Clostridia bacterium]|nr:DUF4956 domain-containing protein [Clostridia bacterium]MBQ7788268.1 DUF4956 domain-containing protein [Clostridia bacterium]
MDFIIESIFEKALDGSPVVETWSFFVCLVSAIILGLVVAFCYMFRNDYSRNLVISIAIMPVIVSVLIMLVSGSIGAAIAVGGVFALTRFRSAQGTAKEITQILLSMGIGLTIGLGFIYIAIVLVIFVEALCIIFNLTNFGESNAKRRTLKISIPEELDYTEIFDDIFEKYALRSKLIKVKLKNLGTLFQLTYDITLKDVKEEKKFIDELRVRNANLDIVCSRIVTSPEEL